MKIEMHTPWKSTETRVYFSSGAGGFCLRNCPDAEEKAAFIVRACNDYEQMKKSLIEAQWFIDHVMGKEKRVNWGDTFNIDWGKVNTALIEISKGAKLAAK